MSDQAALLRAIVDDPEDLALRLVYADWLDEHGHDRHAAFIRTQCALEGFLADVVQPHFGIDNRYIPYENLDPWLAAELIEPLRPVLDAAGVPWRQTSFDDHRSVWFGVRRGFVEQVMLRGPQLVRAFLRHADDVLACLPLRGLTLNPNDLNTGEPWPATPELFRLLACEAVPRLDGLNLTGFQLDGPAVEALLAIGPVRWKNFQPDFHRLDSDLAARLRERFGPNMSSYDDIPF